MNAEKETLVVAESSPTLITLAPKKHMGMRTKNGIGSTVIYVILVLMSVIWLFPFVCIFLQSFEINRNSELINPGSIFPVQWGWDNYKNLFDPNGEFFKDFYVMNLDINFNRWLLNTFIVSLATAALQTVIVLCMSYTLSRLRFKGRKFLMKFMLILGMFPGMLTMIILYRVLADLGLTQQNSIPGLILVYVASSGMGYYISKGFFDTIPKSLDEAARVDGATRAQVLFKVILPLSKPIVIYTILTAFMGPWGDFVFAAYVAFNNKDGMNVAVGLQNLVSGTTNIVDKYRVFCAGGVIIAIPITLLFLLLQKYYVEGVTGGAVKG